MRRTLLIALLLVGAALPAAAQDRYVFGYTHSDDLAPPNAVQLVTDQGIFTAFVRGWFDDTGFHHPGNDNYLAGRYQGHWYRDFFWFDLGGSQGLFGSASLRILNPHVELPWCDPGPYCDGFSSPFPSETYFLRFLDPGHLRAMRRRATGRTDLYDALGSGTIFGHRPVSGADNGTWVDLPLNPDGLADLNQRGGEVWGVGGELLDGPRLQAVTTPEPATVALTGGGLALLALAGYRRRA